MQLFSSKPSSIFILIVLLTTLLPPTVRSDHNVLKLPSDQQENDLCSLDSESNTCPVKCFRPDPVCGVDGVTYWCGCADAHCAGTRVKKFGYCEVGNGGSGPAGQALLLVHIIWLILLGVFVLFGLLWLGFILIFYSQKFFRSYMRIVFSCTYEGQFGLIFVWY